MAVTDSPGKGGYDTRLAPNWERAKWPEWCFFDRFRVASAEQPLERAGYSGM